MYESFERDRHRLYGGGIAGDLGVPPADAVRPARRRAADGTAICYLCGSAGIRAADRIGAGAHQRKYRQRRQMTSATPKRAAKLRRAPF